MTRLSPILFSLLLAAALFPAFAQDDDDDAAAKKRLAAAEAAPATNAAPSAMDKHALELIVRNNIFDPTRTGYHPRPRPPRIDTFTYCGYAFDKNPPAAFFSGSGAPRHPVEPGQSINGFKVESADFTSVKLKPENGPDITLAMGMSMRKVENGPWKPSENTEAEEIPSAASTTSTNGGKVAISASDSDIIKKLKEKHNEDN